MLAQDSLGYVHEVPDPAFGYALAEYPDGSVAQVPVALDGYGSPVGLPFLAPIAAALAPMAAQAAARFLPTAAQAVGRLVGGAVPRVIQAVNAAGQLVGQGVNAFRQGVAQGGAIPVPGGPVMVPSPVGPIPIPRVVPRPYFPRPIFRAPPPVGWVTPALPFTGRAPRRMYLRCAVWPGGAGLVPASAMLPPPGTPGAPGMPPVPPAGGRRRRRRGRR